MKIILLFFTFINFSFSQDLNESKYSITEAPDPNPSFISFLSSIPINCDGDDSDKSCTRSLIYEKDNEQIFQMITDGPLNKKGSMDVGVVLRSPSSYDGEIQTINLNSLFSGQEKFDSVIARYTKEGKIYIEVEYGKKRYNKTIDVPSSN